MTDYSVTDEYDLLSKAGLSFPQILTALTTAPAKRFGLSESHGKNSRGNGCRPGRACPQTRQTDITALAGVTYTISKGKIIYTRRPL